MRIFIPLLLLFAVDIYTFQALQLLAEDWSEQSQMLLKGIFWGISALTIGYIFLLANGLVPAPSHGVMIVLRAAFYIILISKILVGVFLLIDDVRRILMWFYASVASDVAFDPSRSRFLAKTGLVVSAAPFLTLFYGMFRNSYRYKIHRETVKLDNLPEKLNGLKIVQISDIHSGSFFLKEPIKNGIEMINREKADLVFFTGDLVNSIADEFEPFTDVFEKIRAKHGVFSVLGNHDYGDYVRFDTAENKQRNLQKLIGLQRGIGWDLLLNENRVLNINGEKLAVIGIENASGSKHFKTYGDPAKAYRGAESAPVKLLLSHDPSFWLQSIVPGFPEIDVTFSGHTHGFQFGIEIPGFLKWSPSKYVYKEWAGLYQKGKQFLYVNRGFGFLGYPGRIGILPEITVLTLENSKNEEDS